MPGIERGGVQALCEEILAAVEAIAVGSSGGVALVAAADNLRTVVTDETVEFTVKLYDPDGNPRPTSEITPGTYAVYRIRGGSESLIVAATPSSESLGRVYCTYTFPSAGGVWAPGDLFWVKFAGIEANGNPVPVQVLFGIVALDHSVEQVYAALTHATYGLEAIKTALDGVASDVAALDLSSLAGILDGVSATGTDTDAILDLLTDETDGLAAINTNVGAVGTGVASVNDAVAVVDGVVDSVKTDTTDIRSLANDASHGFSALKAAITTVDTQTDILADGTNGLAAIKTAIGTRATPYDVTQRVQTELNGTLTTTPNANSLWDILHKNGSLTYDKATDSLEAIADKLATFDAPVVRSSQSGTLTASASEQTLFEAAPGTLWKLEPGGFIDLSALADTLSVTLKVYVKIKSGGTYRQIASEEFTGTAGAVCIPVPAVVPIGGTSYKVVIPEMWNTYGLKVTAQQTVQGAGYIAIDHQWYVRGVA
jgi:hypothetical protein